MDWKEKLKSRKFLMAVAGVVVDISLALAGAVDWQTALTGLVALIGVYVIGQSFVDAKNGE